MEISAEYKGFNIRYCDWEDDFSCHFDGSATFHSKSIKEIKSQIDKACKTDLKGRKAFMVDGSGFLEVDLTSRTDEGKYWVRTPHGTRRMISGAELYPISESNTDLIEKIIDKREAITKLLKEKAVLYTLLAPLE